MRNDLQLIIAEDIDGALVFGQSIIEGDFHGCQPSFFALVSGLAHFLCQRDQLLQDFDGTDGVGVIARNRFFQPLGNPMLMRRVTVLGTPLASRCLSGAGAKPSGRRLARKSALALLPPDQPFGQHSIQGRAYGTPPHPQAFAQLAFGRQATALWQPAKFDQDKQTRPNCVRSVQSKDLGRRSRHGCTILKLAQ